jgi:hypothetical protein
MATLVTSKARAYVNFGRWIADCPTSCGSAIQLQPGQAVFQCVECYFMTSVEWPNDPDGIWEALGKRPANKHRNWFPSGHELALRSNSPHGQTVKDLEEETLAHMDSATGGE